MNTPPLREQRKRYDDSKALPVPRRPDQCHVRGGFVDFFFKPERMSNLGQLKYNQWISFVATISMEAGKHTRCLSLLQNVSDDWQMARVEVQGRTKPLATRYRGLSGMNHTVQTWMIGIRACTRVGILKAHWLPPAC